MKFLRNLLPIAVVALGFASSAAYADCDFQNRESFHNANRQRDFEAVQEFVNSKRTISLGEKDCNLSISGDIRFDWAHLNEKVNCHRLRKGNRNGTARQLEDGFIYDAADPAYADLEGRGAPFSNNAFNAEFNLYFDYICDRAWGVAWLQFLDAGGIEHGFKNCDTDPQGLFGSGCCDNLCLRKAYLGYNICADGCSRFDIELGRRPLYSVFDSRMQFQSRFDGILLKYNRGIECWGDFYWYLGGFVVDERVDHYAYVTELGLLNIYDCGFDFRYSFIDWKSLQGHKINRCFTNRPLGADYRINQFTLAYNFNPEYLCVPSKIYGAFLWNSASPRLNHTQRTDSRNKENIAWYVGFIIGEVCHEGDWSFDMNYQVCELFAIPEQDFGGIGSFGGNLLADTPSANLRGFNNYKGWRFEGLYALTDNLSIDAILEFSKQDKKFFAGKHSYSKFELQAIYAF